MNLNSLLLSILVLLFVLSSCDEKNGDQNVASSSEFLIANGSQGKWQEEKNIDIEVIEQFSFLGEEEIGSILFLNVHPDGSIYFVDGRNSKLIKLNPSGEVIKTSGQQGRGPGDIEMPYNLLISDEYIFLSNIQGTRVDKYDLELNFIESFIMSEGLSRVRFGGIGPTGYPTLLTSIPGKAGGKIILFNPEEDDSLHATIELTEDIVEDLGPFKPTGESSFLFGNIIYTHDLDYEIEMVNTEGVSQLTIKRDLTSIFGPAMSMMNGGLSVFSLGFISKAYQINEDYFVVDVKYPTNIESRSDFAKGILQGEEKNPAYKRVLDLYNKKGELLYVFDDQAFFERVGMLNDIRNEVLYFVNKESAMSITKVKLSEL